jgi:hypothetical protein
MTFWVTDVHAYVQRLVSVVKIATVLEENTTEEQRSQCKRYLKKIVYIGNYLSRKHVYNWVEKFSQGRSKIADDTRPGAKVVDTTIKRLLFCRLRSTGKAMGQLYQYW